jgi:glycosyltransferase involved in cell wall biosynthesis
MRLSFPFRRTLRRAPTPAAAIPITGHVDEMAPSSISGWAADRSDFGRQLVVVLVREEHPLKLVRADGFRADLKQAGIGAGRHAFAFRFPVPTAHDPARTELYALREETACELGLIDGTGSLRPTLGVAEFRSLQARASDRVFRLPAAAAVISAPSRRYRRETTGPLNLLEIVDLLSFFHFHNRVTGIQRVVSRLIRESLADPGAFAPFEFCVSTDFDEVLVLPRATLLSVIERILEGDIGQAQLIEEIAKMREGGLRLSPERGDRFVITGAYWIVANYGPTLLRLKAKGVVTAAYIYDLIPITASQYVTDSTRDEVIERGIEVLSICDFFMTISEFVEREVHELLRNELGRRAVTRAVKLPHEVPYRLRGDVAAPRLHPRPYVLCVGTLEGRKNHALLFKVWAGLIRKHGLAGVPDLVLVGKWGWKIEAFRELCAESGYLEDKIFVLQGISDSELSVLYRDCLFTVFPSFVEGWGLPVGESLAAGKFCVASNTSSVPEVGGTFVDYVSPYDYFEAFRVIERVMLDGDYLAERERNIRENFMPRTWADTTRLFHAAISDLAADAAGLEGPRMPHLRPGDFYPVQLTTGALATWPSREIKFILAEGWYPLESWGVWGSAPVSTLRFFTGCTEGDALRVLLRLVLPPEQEQGSIEIADGRGVASWAPLSGDSATLVEVTTAAGADGQVELSLGLVRYEADDEAERPVYAGLTGIAFCRSDDVAEAAGMLRGLVQTRPATETWA